MAVPVFFLVLLPPRNSTLFPYTTLFRSLTDARGLRFIHYGFAAFHYPAHVVQDHGDIRQRIALDRKSTRLNSSHVKNSYAVFCLKKKNRKVAAAVNGLLLLAMRTAASRD